MAAPVPSLVFSGPERMRYLLTGDGAGGTLTFTNTGAATPDLQTDAVAGPLKRIMLAHTNGIGTIAAGTVLSVAQARAILLSDGTVSVGNANVPRAIVYVQTPNRSGTTAWTLLDALADGSGNPTLTITASAAAGTTYLDIIALGVLGN